MQDIFPNLQHLVLKETTITTWQDMTNLATWLSKPKSGLKSLKVTFKPDQSASSATTSTPRMTGTRADRVGLIARFPDLEELNSSPVSFTIGILLATVLRCNCRV
jgi:hypothetical protein